MRTQEIQDKVRMAVVQLQTHEIQRLTAALLAEQKANKLLKATVEQLEVRKQKLEAEIERLKAFEAAVVACVAVANTDEERR